MKRQSIYVRELIKFTAWVLGSKPLGSDLTSEPRNHALLRFSVFGSRVFQKNKPKADCRGAQRDFRLVLVAVTHSVCNLLGTLDRTE